MLTDEARYKILKKLEANPDISQRQLAEELGISLGKVNYCLQALIDKGFVKAKNFSNNPNKRRYLYVLTPAGIESRAKLTARFLKRKMAEYEALKQEIEEIQQELAPGQSSQLRPHQNSTPGSELAALTPPRKEHRTHK